MVFAISEATSLCRHPHDLTLPDVKDEPRIILFLVPQSQSQYHCDLCFPEFLSILSFAFLVTVNLPNRSPTKSNE